MKGQKSNLEFHQVIEIWKEYSHTLNPDEVALNLNVSISEVYRVINGEIYPESKQIVFKI